MRKSEDVYNFLPYEMKDNTESVRGKTSNLTSI